MSGPPEGIGIVDTMIGFPMKDARATYSFVTRLTRDSESREQLKMPAGYMFKDVPEPDLDADPVAVTLREMDLWGIEVGLCGCGEGSDGERALRDHPDRFVGALMVDPNDGVEALRRIRRRADELGSGLRAVQVFPAGCSPQVPLDDPRMFPLYALCCELGLPVFVMVGVPGPRVPMACQDVELLDRVMYEFPELTVVMRHGAEPWEDLAVKLMLKWPNLHYSTSAFAPKHYPRAVVDHANTRGADQVMYAGYFPMGLSLQRIMGELTGVPLREDVWPRFLRDNARRVLGLGASER